MTEFPKMQARFEAALAKMNEAVATAGDASQVEALNEKIQSLEADAEKAATALQEAEARIETLEGEVAAAAKAADEQRTAMVKQIDGLDKARANSDADVAKSGQYNKHLKKLNSTLRKRNEEMVGDPGLINKSLEAELTQIKAQRDVDLEEVNGILARMTPLVEGI